MLQPRTSVRACVGMHACMHCIAGGAHCWVVGQNQKLCMHMSCRYGTYLHTSELVRAKSCMRAHHVREYKQGGTCNIYELVQKSTVDTETLRMKLQGRS